MAPPLFSRVARAEALAAFDAGAHAPTYCGGDFVKLDDAVLVFATFEGDSGARLAYADTIIWHGTNLPMPVRQTFDADRKRIFEHHVLVRRSSGDESWLYCGRAHLGSWSDQDGLIEASFSLEEGKLSLQDWRVLGGRETWEIQVNGQAQELEPGDVEVFCAWLAKKADDELLDIWMTAPSGATFTFFINATRAAVFFVEGVAEPFSLSLRDPNETSDELATFFESLGPANFTHERYRTLPRIIGLHAAIIAFRGELLPRPGVGFDFEGVPVVWSKW